MDLANYINVMGGKVRGAGTTAIRIDGVESMKGGEHTVIPDRIEAGTFMVAGAMTQGDILVDNVLCEHMKPLIAKLREAGAIVEEGISDVHVVGPQELHPITIKTLPYPGFPTDMQAQVMAMMCIAKGQSSVLETVFENRFMHVDELLRMGFYFGFDGPLTYPNSKRAKRVASHLPLDRMLIETDCPYLTPQAHRGQRNEPAYVHYVAEAIAALRGIDAAEVARATTENAKRLFAIP